MIEKQDEGALLPYLRGGRGLAFAQFVRRWMLTGVAVVLAIAMRDGIWFCIAGLAFAVDFFLTPKAVDLRIGDDNLIKAAIEGKALADIVSVRPMGAVAKCSGAILAVSLILSFLAGSIVHTDPNASFFAGSFIAAAAMISLLGADIAAWNRAPLDLVAKNQDSAIWAAGPSILFVFLVEPLRTSLSLFVWTGFIASVTIACLLLGSWPTLPPIFMTACWILGAMTLDILRASPFGMRVAIPDSPAGKFPELPLAAKIALAVLTASVAGVFVLLLAQ